MCPTRPPLTAKGLQEVVVGTYSPPLHCGSLSPGGTGWVKLSQRLPKQLTLVFAGFCLFLVGKPQTSCPRLCWVSWSTSACSGGSAMEPRAKGTKLSHFWGKLGTRSGQIWLVSLPTFLPKCLTFTQLNRSQSPRDTDHCHHQAT